uniref:Uncharacterized protein n=1 Tax=Arundo donax TaxID=35708 RepID=A0A0A9BM38_ARUDO
MAFICTTPRSTKKYKDYRFCL